MKNLKLAATTGFLDRIDLENETVWLGGWFLSFESEPVEKLKIYIGNTELTDFEITRNLPSPGVKKVHPNISTADRCRFLIKLHLPPSQQQQFRDALISLIPIIQGREGEPLLTAVNPSLSSLLKKSEPEAAKNGQDAASTPEVELIYVHVPKAAGTAFRKILQQVYGPQKVLTDTTNMFEDNMPPTIDRQTKVIDGHFRAGKYDRLFPNSKTITWLRQPIHRLISDYCFRQMGSMKEKDFLSKERLLEFARITGNRNLISYCFNGKPLNYFHFVGIIEYFEEDLEYLRDLMGWKEVKSVYQNRNPYPEYNEFKKAVLADKELMAELTALNSQDIKLYQSAWKLRDQRKKGLISLPLTPPPRTEETSITGKMPVLRSGETEEKSVAAEPVPTLGSIDKVAVTPNSPASSGGRGGLDGDRLLEITGWTFSRQAGLPDGFKLSLGGLEVANLQKKLRMPSPDVKKIHPKFPTAAKARFQLKASLTRVPAGETEVTLTPMFKGRPGKPMVKGLSLGGAPVATKAGKIPEAIATNQTATKQKITVGYLDQAKIENGKAIVKGWVGSMGGGPLKGFKISIGGNHIAEFQPTLNLPSPDVAKKHPHLDNSGAARFRVVIPLPPNQLQEYQDSLLALTPIFETGKGQIMTKVLASAGNKSLGYEIVSVGGSEKVLFNGKLLPIPPKTLRTRVHGSGDLHDFLSKGLGINRDIKAALKRIGKDWSQFKTVLDVGCGSGRVMMWLAADLEADGLAAAEIYGTDIDPAAISWCSENLNLATFGTNKALPPLEYEDNKFDLIYLVSVFTHINEEMQLKWLEEFKRIAKPEGIVVITISSSPKNPQQAAKLGGELEEKGIVFVKTHAAKDSVFPAWYQTTYLSEGYLREKWANYLDVVDYIPGGIRGNQDVVILRKNSAAVQPVEQASRLLEKDVTDGLSVGEQSPKIAEAITTNEAPPIPPPSQGGPGGIKQPFPPPSQGGPGGIKRSPLLEKVKAQLERSQTEMQQVRADLEGSKTGKKEGPEKKTEKLAADFAEDLTDGLSVGKQASPSPPLSRGAGGDSSSSAPLSRGAGGDPLPLLGLSGVTVEKFWSLVDPVIEKQKQRPTSNPSVSILTPTWNSSLDWFVETVLSVLHQTNFHWEWCLVDDGSKNQDIKTVLAGLAEKEPRIKVRFAESSGISGATNKALEMATGEFICCLDHDDTLAPTALEDSLEVLTGGTPVLREEFDVSYSDEDKIDLSGLNYIQPFFKPDWSPEYFRGVMYVGHLLCVRRELALQVGGFKSEFDGVQDYEFMLRVSELTAKIAHIPKHLYHWRQVRGSISADADAKAGIETVQQAAVNAHLQRLGLPAKAEPGVGRHRVNINPHPRSENPLVSLIIPSLNPDDRLGPWLNELLSKTVYPNLEVIVVLTYEKTEQLPETIHNFRVKTISLPNNPKVKTISSPNNPKVKTISSPNNPSVKSVTKSVANFSRANNFAAKEATGEYLVFLKPGVIPHADTPDWLRHFLYYAEQSDVAAVGGLLLFADNITVEHAGIVVGEIETGEIATSAFNTPVTTDNPSATSAFNTAANFAMRDFKAGADGYAGSLVCAREVSAVSKDCLMVKKNEFERLGGFNEHLLTGYQEVDLCMRLRRENKRVIFTPRSVLINPHSTNLELENSDFLDKMLLLDSHQIEIDKGDPYHNPNLVIEVPQ